MKPTLEGIETMVIVVRTQLEYAQLKMSLHVYLTRSGVLRGETSGDDESAKEQIWEESGMKPISIRMWVSKLETLQSLPRLRRIQVKTY